MARVEVLVDDVDRETVAKHSLTYQLNGQWRALDLNDEHFEQLMKAFEMFDDYARPLSRSEIFGDVSARRSPGRPRKQSGDGGSGGGDTRPLREWARANGYEIGDRGRIKPEIKEAYERALAAGEVTEPTAEPTEAAVSAEPGESEAIEVARQAPPAPPAAKFSSGPLDRFDGNGDGGEDDEDEVDNTESEDEDEPEVKPEPEPETKKSRARKPRSTK